MHFLGWHWLIKLYRLQVYNSITHHLYIVLCVYHPSQVSFHRYLSPCPLVPPPLPFSPVTTTVLSVSMRLFYVCMYVFCLILSCFHPAPQPSSHLTAVSLLPIYESVSILLVNPFCSSYSTYEWNHMVLVFLWLVHFIYHNIFQVHLCHYKG